MNLDKLLPDERIALITRKANNFLTDLLDAGFRADEVALALASAVGQADAAFIADGSFAELVNRMSVSMAKSCAIPKVPYNSKATREIIEQARKAKDKKEKPPR